MNSGGDLAAQKHWEWGKVACLGARELSLELLIAGLRASLHGVDPLLVLLKGRPQAAAHLLHHLPGGPTQRTPAPPMLAQIRMADMIHSYTISSLYCERVHTGTARRLL